MLAKTVSGWGKGSAKEVKGVDHKDKKAQWSTSGMGGMGIFRR